MKSYWYTWRDIPETHRNAFHSHWYIKRQTSHIKSLEFLVFDDKVWDFCFDEQFSNWNKMAKFDAVKKQWGSLEPPAHNDSEALLGQRILNLLAKHGSKVAQVWHYYYFLCSPNWKSGVLYFRSTMILAFNWHSTKFVYKPFV